jgi:hypothetical protein
VYVNSDCEKMHGDYRIEKKLVTVYFSCHLWLEYVVPRQITDTILIIHIYRVRGLWSILVVLIYCQKHEYYKEKYIPH